MLGNLTSEVPPAPARARAVSAPAWRVVPAPGWWVARGPGGAVLGAAGKPLRDPRGFSSPDESQALGAIVSWVGPDTPRRVEPRAPWGCKGIESPVRRQNRPIGTRFPHPATGWTLGGSRHRGSSLPLDLLSRSSLQLGHVGFQLGYLRLQRAQIGGVGGALEPHQYPRHDLRRQIGAQRLHFAGKPIQPSVNTIQAVALLGHLTGEPIQPSVNTIQAVALLGHLTGEPIQPSVNTVQAPAHIAQTDPYFSHLATQLVHCTEYVP